MISILILASFFSFSQADFVGFKDDAAKALKNCSYLKETYPQSYAKIDKVADRSTVILSKIDIPNAVAIAIRGYIKINDDFIPTDSGLIILSNSSWDDKNPKFQSLLDYKKIMAHELLHLIGLPDHKIYKSKEDYLFNDEIEFTIKSCFMGDIK